MLLLFKDFLPKRSSEETCENSREEDEGQQDKVHMGRNTQTKAGTKEEGCGIVRKWKILFSPHPT